MYENGTNPSSLASSFGEKVSIPERKTMVSSIQATSCTIGDCLNVLESLVSVIRGSSPTCNEKSAQSPNCLLDDIDILQKNSENLLKGLYTLKEYIVVG